MVISEKIKEFGNRILSLEKHLMIDEKKLKLN